MSSQRAACAAAARGRQALARTRCGEDRAHARWLAGLGPSLRPLTAVSRWSPVPSPRLADDPPPGRAIYLRSGPSPRRCAARWRVLTAAELQSFQVRRRDL